MIVTIDIVSRTLTAGEKHNLIHRLTEAAVEVSGEAARDLISVRIRETDIGHWAVGGRSIAARAVGTSDARLPGRTSRPSPDSKKSETDPVFGYDMEYLNL